MSYTLPVCAGFVSSSTTQGELQLTVELLTLIHYLKTAVACSKYSTACCQARNRGKL